MNKADLTKNPALWMMVGVPLFSILTSACLIYMAITSFDGLVVDDYYKKGKEINVTLDRDRVAANAGLNADFVLSPDEKKIEVTLHTAASEQYSYPQKIVAKFLHRTLSGRDISVLLERVDVANGVYIGEYPGLTKSRWLVELGNIDWRLTGEMVWPAQPSFELEFDPTLVGQK